MPARPPELILQDLIHGRGTGAKFQRKLAAGKESNWLLAITLNAFAKLDANARPTDLEQIIIKAFRDHGYSDDDMKSHGRLFQQMPEATKRMLFPGTFAGLTPRSDYSVKELKADLPGLQRNILGQANALDIDVGAIHQGTAHRRDFAVPAVDVVKEHGSGLLRAVEADRPNRAATTPRYTIKAISFHCSDETGTDWWGSDEPYWVFGSLAEGSTVTTRSEVFGDVDSGSNRSFKGDDGCIWGQNCQAQPLPDGEIGTLIQLWEHDSGDPDDIKNGVAAAFAAAAGILAATGAAAWIAALTVGVGKVVQWLLGYLDDDHIADQTIIFSRQTIESQLTKTGSTSDRTQRFSDGDGDYTLKIRLSRVG